MIFLYISDFSERVVNLDITQDWNNVKGNKRLSASEWILIWLLPPTPPPCHLVKLFLICICSFHLIGFQEFGGTEAGIWTATTETSWIPSQTVRCIKCKILLEKQSTAFVHKLGFFSSLFKKLSQLMYIITLIRLPDPYSFSTK